MTPKKAVVLIVDRLGTEMLGPYGNAWTETEAFNRLACLSMLQEFAVSDSPRLEDVYRSYWLGRHAFFPDPPSAEPPKSLAERLFTVGVETTLLTDAAPVAELPWAAAFSRRRLVPPLEVTGPAEDLDQTSLAELFGHVLDHLETSPAEGPELVWVHARELDAPWDAPYEFRARFADEDDPEPPTTVEAPHRKLEEPIDPDVVLGYSQAYAGQVVALDLCLSALLEELFLGEGRRADENTLFVLTSPRGFPLGGHGRLGDADPLLGGAWCDVPWFTRFPDAEGAVRNAALVQPVDLFATLLDWFGLDGGETPGAKSLRPAALNEPAAERRCAVARLGRQRLLRTGAWQLAVEREPDDQSLASARLYMKPDDRWEFNEVSDRCPEITAKMYHLLQQIEAGDATGLFTVEPEPELQVPPA